MKMLGNDVLTQQEFDSHMDNEFNPLRDKLEDAQKKIRVLQFVAYPSLVLSILSVLLLVIKH